MVSRWKINFGPQARVEFKNLPKTIRRATLGVIEELREDPAPPGSEPLQAGSNIYRKVYLPDGYRMLYVASRPRRTIYIDRIRLHDYGGFGD